MGSNFESTNVNTVASFGSTKITAQDYGFKIMQNVAHFCTKRKKRNALLKSVGTAISCGELVRTSNITGPQFTRLSLAWTSTVLLVTPATLTVNPPLDDRRGSSNSIRGVSSASRKTMLSMRPIEPPKNGAGYKGPVNASVASFPANGVTS